MIPKIIHYCWFGRGEMPELAKQCIASWHKHMPDWEYRLWNEDNFDVSSNVYAKEAYEAGKYAFVSDFVRLWALERVGGLYLDTDVEVFKPFDDLMNDTAFSGFEGSKHLPVGTCVLASKAHGQWVSEQLSYYNNRHFILDDGQFDLTTNVLFISRKMEDGGLILNGKEQRYADMHVYPVDYFSPRLTTGEYVRTDNTYSEHKGLNSWSATSSSSWKSKILSRCNPKLVTALIKIKRKIVG